MNEKQANIIGAKINRLNNEIQSLKNTIFDGEKKEFSEKVIFEEIHFQQKRVLFGDLKNSYFLLMKEHKKLMVSAKNIQEMDQVMKMLHQILGIALNIVDLNVKK